MAIILMLSWWYGRGWLWIINVTNKRLQTIGRIFAVSVLIQTWFSPWKQIYREATFRNYLSIALDNAVSRSIGAVVRGTILLWALILSLGVIIIGIGSFIIWPFLPLMIIILPILAITGVTP
jgi:hypothetical protein